MSGPPTNNQLQQMEYGITPIQPCEEFVQRLELMQSLILNSYNIPASVLFGDSRYPSHRAPVYFPPTDCTDLIVLKRK